MSIRLRWRRSVLTLFVAVAAGACAAGATRTAPADLGDESPGIGPIVLAADNRNASPVTIYAVRGTIRQRIGSVAGGSQAELLIPSSLTNDRAGVMVQVVPLAGSERYLSELLTPAKGDRVALTIQPRLSTSSVAIR